MYLYIDIETVSNGLLKDERKDKYEEKNGDSYGLYPEFGKVICVSCGYEKDGELVVTSFSGDNEQKILEGLHSVLDNDYVLVGHNITTFDIPFLAKRYMANGQNVPKLLRLYGVKPWDVNIVDTGVVWKSGSYRYTSLDIVCKTLGVKTPKDGGIDGSMVQGYYDDGKLKDIVKYCERDVHAVYDVHKKLQNLYI